MPVPRQRVRQDRRRSHQGRMQEDLQRLLRVSFPSRRLKNEVSPFLFVSHASFCICLSFPFATKPLLYLSPPKLQKTLKSCPCCIRRHHPGRTFILPLLARERETWNIPPLVVEPQGEKKKKSPHNNSISSCPKPPTTTYERTSSFCCGTFTLGTSPPQHKKTLFFSSPKGEIKPRPTPR